MTSMPSHVMRSFVDINGNASDLYHIPAGVPQGSLSSPHLFNVVQGLID